MSKKPQATLTRTQFEKRLLAAGFTPEAFNTCNDWGFGGGVGTRYTRGNTLVRVFTAYYRRGPSELHVDGKNPNGALAAPSPKDFARIASVLNI